MICACCQLREATKSNTHFLTDAIIRPCLNIDGSSDREKGLYANLSNVSRAEIGFQRNTPIEPLEREFKRPPSDEEIEKAKKNPYSVDGVFCPTCESTFTEIENEFTSKILPKLRSAGLIAGILTFSDVKTIRLFSYLQFWRSSICVPEFALPISVKEDLRKFILNHRTLAAEQISSYPLSIAYLETLGGDSEYTKNYIAHLRFENPFMIIMCDFIIQLYDSEKSVKLLPFYNINEPNFREFININEKEFRIRILTDIARKTFLKAYGTDIAKERIEFYATRFIELWKQLTGKPPSKEILGEYLYVLTKDGEENMLNYTQAVVTQITTTFVAEKLG